MLKLPEKRDKRTKTEKYIDVQIEDLAKYTQTAEDVKDVLELMEKRRDLNKKDRISKETIAAGVINLSGILLILHYEQLSVVTSKALQFVLKRGRV